ncbi:hypothetical protein OC861_006767 [Tilletia horrida]|nr:hypothetical protein OC845_006844 [Tilletia horrida]KAK0559035.1 hypothetical protein OC861_006767 [Tilletia horrida]
MNSFTWTCCKTTFTKRDHALKHWQRVHDGTSDNFPIASRQGQRSTDPDLVLWREVTSSWSQLPENHPRLPQGAAIFGYFMASRVPFNKGLTRDISDSFATEPRTHHLMSDAITTPVSASNTVAAQGALIASSTGNLHPDLTIGHLFAGLEAMARNLETLEHPDELCALLNTQHTKNGLLGCQPHQPSSLSHLGITKTVPPECSSAYTPRGHVTDIHMDSIYEGTLVTTLLGRKILLQWPPTAHNLDALKRFHWRSSEWRLFALYDKLEHLQVTLCDHGTVQYIPPGGLHAVFALENSAMMAYGIVHPSMVPEVARLSAWELEHAKELLVDGDPEHGIPNILASHQNDLDTWIKLASRPLMRSVRFNIEELETQLHTATALLTSVSN